MRRTRHVALPVKAWQYIGLLIVSLACLTLGLVSRDKEGRAGSLAGPELEHQAPHEVDACPNSYFFTKMPYSILDDDQTRVRKTSVEPGTRRASSLPDSPRISRSRSLDRSSEARPQSRRDSRIERRLVDREATDLSRLRTRSQESQRRSSDPIRLSRSSDLDARLATRFLDRRSRSVERGSAVDRREGRDTVASRISERRERRERSADRLDVKDRGSRSTERRESILNRETSREDRREVRERRARSLDRREPNFERVNRNRDREDRQRSLANRMDRRADDRRSLARDLRQVRTAADEDRRNARSVLGEKRNSVAARILDSRSRAFERASSYSRINGQYSRSLDRRNSINELPERKLAIRSANVEERRETNTINSRERSMDLQTSDSRRGRIDRSLRTIDGRNRLRLATGRASKSDVDRRFAVRSERQEDSNGRRERMARSDRRLESRSNERRESLARSLERSKVDNLERRERTDRVKRDLDRRARDLSVDRRSERRTLLDSRRSAERQSRNDANRKEIRTERSRINDFERRERSNRVNVDRQARESRDRVARTSERDLDRRTRDLSSDRRSERRASVESRSLERRERSEIRNDRSRINHLERREEPRRVTLAGRARTDLSRTPEAAKRVLERRVRDLSAERRSERRATAEARTLNNRERQEIRNDRSRINNLERREEPRRLTLVRRATTDLSRTPEASNRLLERRFRDLSADRRSERRATVDARTPERRERREIRNNRSRTNSLERVRDLSTERRLERGATVASRSLERRERREIRSDRSRINNFERREESRRLTLARRARTDLSRTPEASDRFLERRVRDLSADRRSERRATVDARTPERRERREIRSDRSRTNSLEQVRDLSADRRLDRRATVASRSLERRERREIRSDRSRINNFERREESGRLTLVREASADLSRTPEASKRDLEVRDSNQRSERRVTVRSRSFERRHAENDKRRVIRVDGRSERRALLDRARISGSNSANRQEIRIDRRSLERSTLTLERSNRLNLARESRILLARAPEASNRDLERRAKDLSGERRSDRRALDAGRPIRSSMAVNRQEKLDRSLDSGRLLRQKMDVGRLQRSNDHTNDIQRRQRLIATRRLLNNVRRSRLVELSDSRGSRKDSMDSLRQIQSSRDRRISDFDEASSRLKISEVLELGDSMKNNMTLEIVRQAIVIGLCAVYGLSILRGKQSFISNLARQPARLIPW